MATLLMTIDSDAESIGFNDPSAKTKKKEKRSKSTVESDEDVILLGHNVLMDNDNVERLPNGELKVGSK